MKYEYRVNGEKVSLEADEDFVAVTYREPAPHSLRASVAQASGTGPFAQRIEVPGEKITILPVAPRAQPRPTRFAATMTALAGSSDVSRAGRVFKVQGGLAVPSDRVLLGLVAGTDPAPFASGPRAVRRAAPDEYVLQLGEHEDALAVAQELAADPRVSYAEPDFVTLRPRLQRLSVGPSLAPAAGDPLLGRQYATKITRALDAWNIARASANVRIAILDEGVDTRHEDLATAVVAGYDAIDDDDFQEPNPWDGHGTACAGLAAAIPANDKGVRGVGGGCSLLAVRIARSDAPGADWTTSNSIIARAVDWSWQNGADVLSNSWGGGPASNAIARAFERARTQGRGGRGCVVVIAAGNDNGAVSFPATLPEVIAVAASNEFDEPKTPTSRDGERWGSNFGPEISLAAPGVHNYTTDITGVAGYNPGQFLDANYVSDFNGTSSATPIVAGAAALLLSVNAELREYEVRAILVGTADKVGPLPYVDGRNDRMGAGRLNVLRAVESALPLA